MRDFDRRSVVAGLAATAIVGPSRFAHSSDRLSELRLFGPPAGPSITLAHAIASGALDPVADKVTFKAWRNPDELRAGLTSGEMNVVVVPTQVAANLFNRGLGVRLVNVMTNGLLYVVSADASLTEITALRNKTVAVPFRNDTPDLIFNRLLELAGMTAGADVKLESSGTPLEAVQLIVAGRVDAALVPEPAATAAIVRGKLAGAKIDRVIDIQKAWASATGGEPVLPQAGLAATETFLAAHGSLLPALQEALARATAAVNADPARAANDAAASLGLPWPIMEQSIPFSNLVAIPARDARPSLEAMFETIAATNPEVIGGALPPAEFYL